jgi:biotin carboxyl carrier protein
MKDKTPIYQEFVVDDVRHLTLLTKKFENRKRWQPPDPNEIRSIIPGTILEVNVEPGQEVREGQTLLVLDAMKMQTKIEMPVDGVVKEVNVRIGDRVPKNMVMIVIQ